MRRPGLRHKLHPDLTTITLLCTLLALLALLATMMAIRPAH